MEVQWPNGQCAGILILCDVINAINAILCNVINVIYLPMAHAHRAPRSSQELVYKMPVHSRIETGTHWWEAGTLTTVPSLLPPGV